MAEETVDFEEMQTNLAQYQEQLQQVEQLLLDNPDNEEYKNIHDSLSEVIQLTKDVLTDAPVEEEKEEEEEEEQPPQQQLPPPPTAPPQQQPSSLTPQPPSTSTLPPQVAQQIKIAQQRAALSGQGPITWAIGAPVTAIYPRNDDNNDNEWHKARVTGINASNGNYIVVFEEYGNQEVEINPADRDRVMIKFREGDVGDGDGDGGLLSSGGGGGGAVYQPIAAPKRNKVEELRGGKKGGGGGSKKSVDVVVGSYTNNNTNSAGPTAAAAVGGGAGVEETMPSWMEILPTDDDKTVAKKKKLQKSWKSKHRFHKMDVETQTKADNWKNFVAKKGTKRKKGTMTDMNKESMFAVPEKGAGVLGGRGITEYAKPKRHNFTNNNDAS